MFKVVEKVIIEYVFTMLKGGKVRGRLAEKMGSDASLKYSWSVSHLYRLTEGAPSPVKLEKTECASREEAERQMFAYLRNYTGIGVEVNPEY